jgi:hypothetical protein
MLRESDILDTLRDGKIELPPLRIKLVGVEPDMDRRAGRPDAYVDIAWADRTFRFFAEIKTSATPRTVREATYQLQSYAEASGMRPLLIAPYLPPSRLEQLEESATSGVDLCGNGIVVVPGEVLVYRTGNRNRYPAGRSIRNVYRGATSLVARVFLLRPEFDSVQEVKDEIVNRGGFISLSTVSKALKKLEEDLVIRREGRITALLDPDRLLKQLAREFRPPRISARKLFRWNGDEAELLERLGDADRRPVLTGAASVDAFAVMPREKTVQCYCREIEPLESSFGSDLEATTRFADLELIETRDPVVYFDSRPTDNVANASPIQCWLELTTGDKRQQDASGMVRQKIVAALQAQGWRSP